LTGNRPQSATFHTASRYKQAEKNNDSMKMNILLHKKRKEKSSPHSGTFGCPDAQATTSQPKEPSFCHRLTDQK